MIKNGMYGPIAIIGLIIIMGFFAVMAMTPAHPMTKNDISNMVVFKSQNCGCCTGYVAELEKRGYDVTVEDVVDMAAVKERYGISQAVESCHTVVIDDYFIEGHVPFAAVEKLLNERPPISGIALPGMPSGSPGMPGIKSEPFVVVAQDENRVTEFVRV